MQRLVAAEARLLVASEGHRHIVCIGSVAVDRYAARANGPRYSVRLTEIPRPDRARQPVARVVGECNRLLRGSKGNHREHGPENLLLSDSHCVVDCIEYGRHHKEATTPLIDALPAQPQPGPFALTDGNVGQYALKLRRFGDRPK